MLNLLHILWELPQEMKVQNNTNRRYQPLLEVGTTYNAAHLGTSADKTLKGGRDTVKRAHPSLFLRVFISPYNSPVVQHGSGAVL